MASAAGAEPAARRATLEEVSLCAALLSAAKIKAAALARSLATIVNVAPELAGALAKARSAAILAI